MAIYFKMKECNKFSYIVPICVDLFFGYKFLFDFNCMVFQLLVIRTIITPTQYIVEQ